ncbi:hypothetical protein [Geopseudomonas aromaticivorans]
MKVKDVEISEAQLAAMRGAMAGEFRASDIVRAAEQAGVPAGEIAMRAADRLIQAERKQGRIKPAASSPFWVLANGVAA